MNKKLLSLILSVTLAFACVGLSACGKQGNDWLTQAQRKFANARFAPNLAEYMPSAIGLEGITLSQIDTSSLPSGAESLSIGNVEAGFAFGEEGYEVVKLFDALQTTVAQQRTVLAVVIENNISVSGEWETEPGQDGDYSKYRCEEADGGMQVYLESVITNAGTKMYTRKKASINADGSTELFVIETTSSQFAVVDGTKTMHSHLSDNSFFFAEAEAGTYFRYASLSKQQGNKGVLVEASVSANSYLRKVEFEGTNTDMVMYSQKSDILNLVEAVYNYSALTVVKGNNSMRYSSNPNLGEDGIEYLDLDVTALTGISSVFYTQSDAPDERVALYGHGFKVGENQLLNGAENNSVFYNAEIRQIMTGDFSGRLPSGRYTAGLRITLDNGLSATIASLLPTGITLNTTFSYDTALAQLNTKLTDMRIRANGSSGAVIANVSITNANIEEMATKVAEYAGTQNTNF